MTMQFITDKPILVVLEATEDFSSPLARASKLCKTNHCKLSVLISCYNLLHASASNNTKVDNPEHQDLAQLVDDLRKRVRTELETNGTLQLLQHTQLSWKEKTVQAIKSFIDIHPFGLIIKAPSEQRDFSTLFRKGSDQYLVSDCPLPVWMIKPKVWDEHLQVISCIDINDDSHENLLMNKKILATSDRIAAEFAAQLHVVDCYFGEIGRMRIDHNAKRGFKREATIREKHAEKIKLFIQDYSLNDDQLHFEEGMPDDAIPSKAKTLQAELVVIGNNEDSELLSKFMDDTAMTLTSAMPCDILVLKPEPSS